MRTLACCLLLAGGCSFKLDLTPPGTDAPPEGIDSPDARPLSPYWVVVGMVRGSVPRLQIFPFDGKQFVSPCAEQASTSNAYAIRDLVPHPTLDKLYAVDSGFHIITPACGGSTFAGQANINGPREIQQIVQDPATGIGFFTMEGAGAIGVYRFTSAPDGTPTVAGMANAISNAGPLAFDPATGQLFMAGVGFARLDQYELDSPGYTFPAAAAANSASCVQPVRLVPTGNGLLLEYCGDTNEVRRIVRQPFGADPTTGAMLGAVDQVAILPNDRVVAARKPPHSDLIVVNNNGGVPTWTTGVTVASKVIAISAAKDGLVVVTSRSTGADSSEIGLWRIDNMTMQLVDVTQVTATVTAVSVIAPGT
jgi:hypothetical protein